MRKNNLYDFSYEHTLEVAKEIDSYSADQITNSIINGKSFERICMDLCQKGEYMALSKSSFYKKRREVIAELKKSQGAR